MIGFENGNREIKREKISESALEIKRDIAKRTGRFYNGLMDVYLGTQSAEERQKNIDTLLEILPSGLRKLYKIGLEKFQEELTTNRNLLEENRGEEIQYLLSTEIAEQEGTTGDKIKIYEHILEHIHEAKFFEPFPGVPFIEVEEDFWGMLQEHGIINGDGHAVNFSGATRDEPSFSIVQRHSWEKKMEEDGSSIKNNSGVRHEFHHFIWNFLERNGGFLREVAELNPELTHAFRYVRDEVAAYIIEGRGVRETDPDYLAYTQDEEALKLTSDARDFITVCLKIAKQKGVHSQDFLFPAMSSRNFAELKENFAIITPLEIMDQEGMTALYLAWGGYDGVSLKTILEFLQRKDINISSDFLKDFTEKYLMSVRANTLQDIFSELRRLKMFIVGIGLDLRDEQQIVEKVLEIKLPLPKETLRKIFTLPREQTEDIPLNKSGEEFLFSLISLWKIDQESCRIVYREIIDSSPLMREIFDRIREEIIRKGTKSFRGEFSSSSEERKQEGELEIQKRVQWLMEL